MPGRTTDELILNCASGVDTFFAGPYYCFYWLPSSKEVQAAYDLILDAIEEDGPFDGVIGFSQGAALAASYLLQDARSAQPSNSFKCAIFFCASMPFDMDSKPFTVDDHGICYDVGTGKVIEGFDITQSIPETKTAGWSGTYDETTEFLHRYTSPYSNLEKAMITIPTTHILGMADDYYQQGCQLRDLCSASGRQCMEHRQGHEIPKDRNATTKMANCIQQLLYDVLIG